MRSYHMLHFCFTVFLSLQFCSLLLLFHVNFFVLDSLFRLDEYVVFNLKISGLILACRIATLVFCYFVFFMEFILTNIFFNLLGL